MRFAVYIPLCSAPLSYHSSPLVDITSLSSTVAPIISPFDFDESVFYGESIQVMCHIPKGDKPLKFVWFFREKPIGSRINGVTITDLGDRSSVLVISAATEKHSGDYTCAASNTAAATNHTATLNVQGTLQ